MKRVLAGCLLSILIVMVITSSLAAAFPFPYVNDADRNYRTAEGFSLGIGDSVTFMIQPGSTGSYIPFGPTKIYDISNSTFTINVDNKKCVSSLGWTFGKINSFSKSQSIENYNAISEVLYEKYPSFNKTDEIVYDVSYHNSLAAIYVFTGGGDWLKKESLYHSEYGLTIVHTLLDCGNNRYLHTVTFDKAEEGMLPVK